MLKKYSGLVANCKKWEEDFSEFKVVKDFVAIFAILGGVVDFFWKFLFPGSDDTSLILPRNFSTKPPVMNDLLRKYLRTCGCLYRLSEDDLSALFEGLPLSKKVGLAILQAAHANLLQAIASYQFVQASS